MTVFSRRAFATAVVALALSLAGCGGHQAGPDAPAHTPGTAAPSSRPAVKSVAALGRSVPVSLQIPAIGVDTPLMQLGLAADGTVQVPPIEAHDKAGWYRYSPTPGQIGPAVILAHVTVGTYGDGVFRDLARLRQGDRIVARLENGTAAVFTVDEVRTVAKAHFPTDAVYGPVDRPELRLITCGGPRGGDGYLDNVIVFATLAPANP
ncbi:class F sortase [Streptomyces sp. NPDC049040]|uniref:class F sortase n=1 Tax=Streptomyces sp. NPDC049040 TaxID=3365593 RepID=UPI0037149A44